MAIMLTISFSGAQKAAPAEEHVRSMLMKKIFKSFFYNPYFNFISVILTIFMFFGISSKNFIETFGKYTWVIDATKWSVIFGAFIFAIHAYVRAEKNRTRLINIKTSAYDEAYKRFTYELSYAFGRYREYKSNVDPKNPKYTLIGVMERMNEVKGARLQLLSVCGEHVRSILLEKGDEWLNDIHSFGKTAPSIMQKLSETAFKDRS